MSTETILLRLRRAASVTNSQGDRLQYRAAADRISLLIAALRSTPTNDAMRDLNGAWAHATRLLLKPLAGGDTPRLLAATRTQRGSQHERKAEANPEGEILLSPDFARASAGAISAGPPASRAFERYRVLHSSC